MTTEDQGISELFMEIVNYAQALGVEKINEMPGCWEHEDGELRFAMNGHAEPKKTADGAEVPGFHAYLQVNGWPAALLSPVGGTIVGGSEDDLIGRVRAAISRARGGDNG